MAGGTCCANVDCKLLASWTKPLSGAAVPARKALLRAASAGFRLLKVLEAPRYNPWLTLLR
jgi:hypothetical protein